MKVVFFGDVVGSIGRRALGLAVNDVKEKINPDLIIANAENIAHGKGVTIQTISQLADYGVGVFTSGNHVFRNPGYKDVFEDGRFKIIRPYNFIGDNLPGAGYIVLDVKGTKVAVCNLQGTSFMGMTVDNPFKKADEMIEEIKSEGVRVIIVDFHAETTSEKQAFGYYLDGRVSAVLGTHTHVQTNDSCILTKGTGYITDIGFVGARNSVLGVDKQSSINIFTSSLPTKFNIPESGLVLVNSVYLNIDNDTGKTSDIETINFEYSI